MQGWICLIGNSVNSVAAIRRRGFRCNSILDKRTSVQKEFLALIGHMLPASLLDDAEVDACFVTLIEQYGLPVALISHTEHGYWHVARLSAAHGLPANTTQALEAVRDKAIMRSKLAHNPTLSLEAVDGDAETIYRYLSVQNSFNIIVKPVDGWGSRGVSHIRQRDDLEQWRQQSAPLWPRWIAEEFIDGPEYSVEVVRFAGVSFVLGVTEKRTTGAPFYVETGHLFPSPSTAPEMVDKILERVSMALDLLDVRVGAVHTEVRVDPVRGPLIIETHTRPGGEHISDLIKYTTGLDIAELSIASVLGQKPPSPVLYNGGAAVRFFLQEDGFCSAIRMNRPINPLIVKKWEFDIVPGKASVTTIDNPTRAGCVFCVGDTAMAAWQATDDLFEACQVEFSSLTLLD